MVSKKERILRTFNYEEIDRPAIYDKIHSLKFIEHIFGHSINSLNSEDAICNVISKTCDMTRHVVVPKDLNVYKLIDDDNFVYKIYWNTKEIIGRPFKTLKEAKELVKKDIFKIREAMVNKRFCNQAKWHLNLFDEKFEYPEELNIEFARIQDRMNGTVMVAPEFFDGLGPITTRYNYDIFIYLYHDYPELMHDLLQTHCEYQLFRIDNFEGPSLSPIALLGTAVSGVQGLIFSPNFLYKEFFPFVKKIANKLKEKGYKVILEMEGNVKEVLEDIVKVGIDAYTPIEEKSGMSIKYIKEKYPKLVLAQNIDSTQLLTYGNKNEVLSKTEEIIKLAKKFGGILIGSSGDINEEVNVENALIMINTVKNAIFD